MKAICPTIIALLLSTSAAYPQQITEFGREYTYHEESTIVFQSTDEPGAVAEIIFNNEINNDDGDLVPTLTFEGITAEITFVMNVNGTADDAISVSVSPGHYAEPETIQVMENFSGTILIYPELIS